MFTFFSEQNEINNWYIFEVKHKSACCLIEHKQSVCCAKFRKNWFYSRPTITEVALCTHLHIHFD